MLHIKMEADCSDAVVKQELDEEHAHLWWDSMAEPDLHFPEEHSSFLKVKDESDKLIIKQELEIGPTVLQSRTHSSLAPTRTAPGTEAEDDYRDADHGVPSDAAFVLDASGTGKADDTTLREQLYDRSDGEGTSMDVRDRAERRYEHDHNNSSTTRRATLANRMREPAEEIPHKCNQCGLRILKTNMRARAGEDLYERKPRECSTPRLGDSKTRTRTHKGYRWCAVPRCSNTTIKTPNKLFVFVPYKKTIRDRWLELARRDLRGTLPSTQLYFCEDHFDLPNDMENYMEYHLMGSVSQIRMKPGCNPSKFVCQLDRRKRTCNTTERKYIVKKQRKLVEEFDKET